MSESVKNVAPLIHPDRLQSLQRIESLTQQMLDHARAGDWEDVIALAPRQRLLLTMFFTQPVPSAEADYVLSVTMDLKRLTELVLSLSDRERTRVGNELHGMRRAHQGVAAYEAGQTG